MDLFNDNCFNVLKNIKKNSIDLFILDLPYNQTQLEFDKEEFNLNEMWKEIKRLKTHNGIIIFFCTTFFGNKLINSNPNWFCYDLIWKKNRTLGFLGANKHPLKCHEMIYIFKKNNNDDVNNERNLELRSYSKKLLEFIGKTSKDIERDLGHRRAEHFFRHSTTQFSLPTQTTYNELIKLYKIDQYENFINLNELKKLWVKNGNYATYNPQKTEGEPYISTHSGCKAEVYGNYTVQKTVNKTDMRYPTSILNVNHDKKSYHPTGKPVEILEWLIKTYSNEGDTVCDFVMGGGSCGVASFNTNRKFIGIEKDKKYFDVAKERIIKLKK